MNRTAYRQYIATEGWRDRRDFFFDAHGYKCLLCGIPRVLARLWDGKDLNLHHMTYANVPNEKAADVEPRCTPCHAAEEKNVPGRTFGDEVEWAVALWLVMAGRTWGLRLGEYEVRNEIAPLFVEVARDSALTTPQVDHCMANCIRAMHEPFDIRDFQNAIAVMRERKAA